MGRIGQYIDALPPHAKDRLIQAENLIGKKLYNCDNENPGGCLRGYAEGFVESKQREAIPAVDKETNEKLVIMMGSTNSNINYFLRNMISRFNKGMQSHKRDHLIRAIKLRAAKGNDIFSTSTIRSAKEIESTKVKS